MLQSTESTLHLAGLMAMAAGQEGLNQVLENACSGVHGESDGGTLELPRPRTAEEKAVTEAWGFVWPEGAVYDRHMNRSQPLAVEVRVPAGWKVVPTDHYLYKHVLDPKGQVRAQLMMHFQDHDSWLTVERKYVATTWQANHEDTDDVWPVIQDSNGNVVWVGRKQDADPDYREKHSAHWAAYHADESDTKPPFEEAERTSPVSPSETARAIAATVLAAVVDDVNDQALFDTPAVFPENQGTLPDLKTYTQRTEYYHGCGGSYADGESSTLRAASDGEAVALVRKRLERNSGGYHRKVRLSDPEGKVILNYEDPVEFRRSGRGGYGTRDIWDCSNNL